MRLHPTFAAAALVCLAALPARAKEGEYVYLRTNPVAIGIGPLSMAPVPQGGAPMLIGDLAGLGFSVGQLEFALNLTSQNLLARPGEFSEFFLRFSTYWRPLKDGRLRFVEPYLFGGLGGGSAGMQVPTEAGCTTGCKYQSDGWGGGPHAGFGFDVNVPLVELENKQRVIAFIGFEVRQELFFHRGPSTYTVFSLPIGVRLD